MKYRKKPVVIEAIQWDGSAKHGIQIRQAFGPGVEVNEGGLYVELTCQTREGPLKAIPGDWVIRGVFGEVYPCMDEVFQATYEPVG